MTKAKGRRRPLAGGGPLGFPATLGAAKVAALPGTWLERAIEPRDLLAEVPLGGRCCVVASSVAVAGGSGLAGKTAVASCLPVVPGGGHAGPPLVDLDQAGFQ